jgi:hypothetical protein
MIEPVTLPMLISWGYTACKWIAGLITGAWAVMKAVNWVKAIRDTDMKNVQAGIVGMQSSLDKVEQGIERQTSAFVTAINEVRADLRTFYVPRFAIPEPYAPVPQPRARKSPAKRKPSVTPKRTPVRKKKFDNKRPVGYNRNNG